MKSRPFANYNFIKLQLRLFAQFNQLSDNQQLLLKKQRFKEAKMR